MKPITKLKRQPRALSNYCLGVRTVFVWPQDGGLPTMRVEQMTKEEIRQANIECNR